MHVGRRALAFDLVRPSANDYRKHIPPRQHGIYLDGPPIETTLPPPVQSTQFEPVILAVDVDVVGHKALSAISSQLSVSVSHLQHCYPQQRCQPEQREALAERANDLCNSALFDAHSSIAS